MACFRERERSSHGTRYARGYRRGETSRVEKRYALTEKKHRKKKREKKDGQKASESGGGRRYALPGYGLVQPLHLHRRSDPGQIGCEPRGHPQRHVGPLLNTLTAAMPSRSQHRPSKSSNQTNCLTGVVYLSLESWRTRLGVLYFLFVVFCYADVG